MVRYNPTDTLLALGYITANMWDATRAEHLYAVLAAHFCCTQVEPPERANLSPVIIIYTGTGFASSLTLNIENRAFNTISK